MAENPVTVDPNAFRAPIPQAGPSPDVSPIAKSVGTLGEVGYQLGQALYQQDQQSRLMQAQLHIAEGMQRVRLQAAREPVLDNIIPTFRTGVEQVRTGAMAFAEDEHTRAAIGMELERARLSAEANVFPDVMKKRAELAHANILTLTDLVFKEAEPFPSKDMTMFKERIDQYAEQLVLSGAASRDRATAWRLAQRAGLDFMKADQAVQNSPLVALHDLQERNSEDPGAPFSNYLDLAPDKRAVLIDRAKAGAQQKAVNTSLLVRQGVTAILSGFGTADGQLSAIAAMGATPQQQAEASAHFAAAGVAKNAVDPYALAAPEEQARIVAAFYGKAVDPANPAMVQVVEAFSERIRAVDHDWQQDPASAADRYFPARLPKDATLADRIALRKAAYAVKGLPFYTDPLSKPEVASIIKTFTELPDVDQRPAYARAVIGSFGQFSDDAIHQLLREKMPWGFVKIADPNISPFAAAQLSAAMKATIGEHRKRYGADPAVATDLEREAIAKFAEKPGQSFPQGDPTQIIEMGQVTALLALQMGDAQRAYDALWGMYKFLPVNGGEARVRFPPGTTDEQNAFVIAQAGKILVDAVSAGGAVIRPPLPGANETAVRHELLTDLPTVDMRTRELKEHGGWLTYSGPNGTDDGIVLTVYGRPAVDKSGQQVRFSWQEVRDYGARLRFEQAQARVQASQNRPPRPSAQMGGGPR